MYIGVQSFNQFFTHMTGLKQSDFQIVARLVSPDNLDGQEYEFEERLDVFLGEDYYENLRHEGLEESKKVHDKIVQSDMLHLQWQEVRDYSSSQPELKKDVIYQVYAGEFAHELASHCAVTARKKRPLLKIKDTNHADLKKSLIPPGAKYLNVLAVISEETESPPLDVTIRSSIIDVNQVYQPTTYREIYLAYEPSQIPEDPEPTFMEEYGRIIAVGFGLLLAAMACLVYWLRKRNTGLKKKLDFVQQTNELVGGTELADISGRASD